MEFPKVGGWVEKNGLHYKFIIVMSKLLSLLFLIHLLVNTLLQLFEFQYFNELLVFSILISKFNLDAFHLL